MDVLYRNGHWVMDNWRRRSRTDCLRPEIAAKTMEKGVAKAGQANKNCSENTSSSVTGISSTGDRSSGFGYVVVVELYGEVLGNRMRLGCRLFTQVSSFLALAVTVAAEVVKTMVAKGYVLGQDALIKGICQNNESYQVSAATTSKFYELAIEYDSSRQRSFSITSIAQSM